MTSTRTETIRTSSASTPPAAAAIALIARALREAGDLPATEATSRLRDTLAALARCTGEGAAPGTATPPPGAAAAEAVERAVATHSRPSATPIARFAREATAASALFETTLDDDVCAAANDREMSAIDNAAVSPATDTADLRIKAALLVRALLTIAPGTMLDTEHTLALRLAAGLLADATTLAAGDPPPA